MNRYMDGTEVICYHMEFLSGVFSFTVTEARGSQCSFTYGRVNKDLLSSCLFHLSLIYILIPSNIRSNSAKSYLYLTGVAKP